MWRKGENTGNQHFTPFLQCFLSDENFSHINPIQHNPEYKPKNFLKKNITSIFSFAHNFVCSFAGLAFPKWQILHSSKLNVFADNNLKFGENGIWFFKWVEYTVGKGKIVLQTCKNQALFGKVIRAFSPFPTILLTHLIIWTTLKWPGICSQFGHVSHIVV